MNQPKRREDARVRKECTKLTQRKESIGEKIVDAAFKVHTNLSSVLLEKVYEVCFAHELMKKDLRGERQRDIQIGYDEILFQEV
jgi:GxxExxY protein